MDQTLSKIRSFVARHGGHRNRGDDDPIFSSGPVNSLLAMQLVLFVEKEFGIAVEDDDLKLENFETIRAIAALVDGKLGRPRNEAVLDVTHGTD